MNLHSFGLIHAVTYSSMVMGAFVRSVGGLAYVEDARPDPTHVFKNLMRTCEQMEHALKIFSQQYFYLLLFFESIQA